MPNRVLALDLTKLYDSSLNEEDQKKKRELVATYRNFGNNSNIDRTRGKTNIKEGNKCIIPARIHEIELSCTERISRQRHTSRGNMRVYPNSARQRESLVVDAGSSFISVIPTRTPQSTAIDPLLDNYPASGPLKILEERANRETKIPTLAKVDILPALGGYELEYSDSVYEPESQRKHRHHNNNHSQIKNQSMLSMMSSLSDTSSVGQMFPPFGEFGELEEKSQFEVPRKKKTSDAPVLRNDREWKKKEDLMLNREFKDFQLVKQLAGGASIMKGVCYQRGVKGTNISQRYQANLEKIMFIRNVYEHRDFRDTFPRETKKSVKKTQLGLKYQIRNGAPATAGTALHNDTTSYSFVRGPPEDKDMINANLHAPWPTSAGVAADIVEGGHTVIQGDKPIVHVPMFVHPANNTHPITSPKQELNNHLYQQRHSPNHLRTSPTTIHNHNSNMTPTNIPLAGASYSSPAPFASKPRKPSFRTQKMMMQHQLPVVTADISSHTISTTDRSDLKMMNTEQNAPESAHGSIQLQEEQSISDGTQPFRPVAVSQDQLSSFTHVPAYNHHGSSTNSGWAPNVPKASELLPEALNLDPTVHVDADSHLIAQRAPQFKLDDGSMTSGVTTTMLLLNGLVQQHQIQAQHQLSHHHYFQHQHIQPSSVAPSTTSATARRYASPPAAAAAMLRSAGVVSAAGVESYDLMSTAAGTVLSSPVTPRSMLFGPVGSNIIISPTSSVDVTTAAFAQGIQHHQAFLSSQMRRVKHDSKRLQQKNMLVFDDPRQDVLSGQPIPQPTYYPKSVVQEEVPDMSSLVSQGHHLSVGHTQDANNNNNYNDNHDLKHQPTSPKSPKIQLMLTMAHRQQFPSHHYSTHSDEEQHLLSDPSVRDESSHQDINLLATGVHLSLLGSAPTNTSISNHIASSEMSLQETETKKENTAVGIDNSDNNDLVVEDEKDEGRGEEDGDAIDINVDDDHSKVGVTEIHISSDETDQRSSQLMTENENIYD